MIFRIPSRSRYAIDALIELAHNRSGAPVKIAEVARRRSIPPRYLEIILNRLKQAGLVASRRGSDGGYWLVSQPETLVAAEILRAVDGPLSPLEQPQQGPVAYRAMWTRVQHAIEGALQSVTLADLIREHEEALQSQAQDWVI